MTVQRTKLKKDYITGLAIILFVFLMLFQVTIAGYLVNKLGTEEMWEKESALAALVQKEDNLRVQDYLSKTGEGRIVKKSLDEIADYLKKYKKTMNRDQIRKVQQTLDNLGVIVHNLNGQTFVTKETLDMSEYMKNIKKQTAENEEIKLYYE